MWIEEKKTSTGITRYVYYERFLDKLTGKYRRVSISLNSKSNQAQKQAQILLHDKIKDACIYEDKTLTFESVANEWLAYTQPTLKDDTYYNNTCILKRLLQFFPHNILLCKVSIGTAQTAINKLYYDNNLSYGYIKKFIVLLRAIYKYAKRLRYIDDISFLEDIEVRRKPATLGAVQRTRNKFLDASERELVIAQLRAMHQRIGLAMEFILHTGLRFGELVALRYIDYDPESHEVDINGTISNVKKNTDKNLRGTPKNIYSIRKVSLDTRSIDIINFFMADNKRMATWFDSYEDRGYIFTSERGNPFNLQQTNKLLKKINVSDKHISTHIFRHTHISLLAELGVPLKVVMERVGHNDPKTTLAVYTHVSSQAKYDVADKLNAIGQQAKIGQK